MYKILTRENFDEFINDLNLTDDISFDLETWDVDFFTAKIRLAQYEVNGQVWILNFELRDYKESVEFFKQVTKLIQSSKKTVVGQNIKFDLKFTLRYTGILLDNIYDTMSGEVVIRMGLLKNNYPSLEELADVYCNAEMNKEVRDLFSQSPVITNDMLIYSATDVKYLKQIKKYQLEEAKNLELERVMKLEMKLLPIVALMEFRGVLLNKEKWLELYHSTVEKMEDAHRKFFQELFVSGSEIVQESMDEAKKIMPSSDHLANTMLLEKYLPAKFMKEFYQNPEEEQKPIARAMAQNLSRAIYLYDKFGIGFRANKGQALEIAQSKDVIWETMRDIPDVWNINSHVQVKAVLNALDYDIYSKKLEKDSAGRDVLSRYKKDEIIQYLLDYKLYSKRVSTYGENWLDHIHPSTGYVHCDWNQLGTDTGRFSSNRPNLQNIIAESEYRNCFVARPGRKMITIDYSQAELRFIAWVAQEWEMINAYINGEDIHAKTASLVFGVPLDQVTKEQRNRGKTLNFSILYGSSPKGISQRNPDISFFEAKDLVEKFFNAYPSLAKFIQEEGDLILNRKYSVTPFGRKRFFENKTVFEQERDYYSYWGSVRREGVNFVIQGGSADSLKLAMVNAWYKNPFPEGAWYFVLQVHDEVSVEVLEEYAPQVRDYIRENLEKAEQVFLGDIPAQADVATQADENGVEQDILDFWTK